MQKILLLAVLFFSFIGQIMAQSDSIQYFGHRGFRGLYPENTIEGFNKALALGIDGIEWDVVVNKDKQLVVSHDPFFESKFCLMPDGSEIVNEKSINMYEMTQAEIETYDCGLKPHPNFPEQLKFAVNKPLLQEVFAQVDLSKGTILFEVKSSPQDDGIYQPAPKEYAELIQKEIADFAYKQNIVFMSFDARIIEEIHALMPEYKCVYLTYLPLKSASAFLKDLTFKPYALGMFYPTIKRSKTRKLKKEGVKAFAWTVNDQKISQKLIRRGVEGIITDYPDRVK
jgi:glycerophosphoryl diester phosphodiesterase